MPRTVQRIPADWRFLLIGRNGMLARAWRGILTSHALPHACLDLPEFDLARPETFAGRDISGVTHLVNCAAWTDVDGAEANEDQARRVNADGPGALAQWADRHSARLVHYSTDYVFDGTARDPYPVGEPHSPIGAYGRTKAEGEEQVRRQTDDHLIVRTSWMYAPWGKCFPRTIARLAGERDELRVVDDQTGRPTSAEHLARTTLALLLRGQTGIWHVTDAGSCTWHELAVEVVRWAGAECAVVPCSTREYPRPAPRPAYSVLDLSRTEQLLGPLPDWRANLADVLRRTPVED